MKDEKQKTNEEWRELLSPEEYRITCEGGTEAPFSGELLHQNDAGQYICRCCQEVLFDSDAKFDSGSGWPSFFQAYSDDALLKTLDTRLGMMRTEIKCSRCNAHLGHVFNDGPKPTGLRYCVNSKSLQFKKH